MICGSSQSALGPSQRTWGGEVFGASVAQSEIVRATLAASESIRWDIWTGRLRASITRGGGDPAPDISGLRKQFGDRISVRQYSSFREITRGQEYIFVTSVPQLSNFDALRQQLGCDAVPLCGILHSAMLQDSVASYTLLALQAQSHDALVATSRAGKLTLERTLQSAQERIARFVGAGAAAPVPRIVQIPLGVDVPPSGGLDRDQARRLLQVPADSYTILYLGRITEGYKADLDPLLQAVGQLAAAGRKVHFILAGHSMDQSYSMHLATRLRWLGIADQTLIMDGFPDFLKSTIMAACDVFVAPSDSVQETFGLAVLEAMAHGRPVIASSWSGYRDLVLHGETGYLLTTKWLAEETEAASVLAPMSGPYDASHYLAQRTVIDACELVSRLEQLADNPELARQMGERGRERVIEQFTWTEVSKALFELWADQIDRARHVQPSGIRLPFADLDRFFSHYADQLISRDDLLMKGLTLPSVVDNLADNWGFSSEAEFEQVGSILELCEKGPVRLGDLQDQGFRWDCIMWLAKKGLCRIVTPGGGGEPR